MKKAYKIILALVAVISILATAYFWGGDYAKSELQDPPINKDEASEIIIPPDKVVPPIIETPEVAPEEPVVSERPKAETVKQAYKTDPVPEGRPKPVEPQDVTMTDEALSCSLSVSCDTILDNMNLLDKEKRELVPDDGVIYATQAVTFYEGESVFNVVQRALKQAGVHFEFVNTPIYNSAYIEGIGNLYAFDVGELSGWTYKVNGWFPNYGASRYMVEADDIIEWVYTCDLGKDTGGGYLPGR